MASQVTNYQCPACTGPLHFDGHTGKLECEYCGSSFEVAEMDALLREKNEKAAAAMQTKTAAGWSTDELSADWGPEGQGMKSYSCPSCGAELICDAYTAATCCPYCGNQTVIPGQFTGALKPEFIVPFRTDKESAKQGLADHYKGKVLLPKSFVQGNHIEDIQGVYVPFWMFDCEAQGDVQYAARNTTVTRSGNEEITTIEHYTLYRSGTLGFSRVPVDASTKMPDGHMDSIEPFDYTDLHEFSMAYMPGFLADKYDVDADTCGERMEERCHETFLDQMDDTATGYDSRVREKENVEVHKGDVHYAMLPVWLLATKWQDKNFIFAMNGQTGKMVGDLPCDWAKFWGIFAGISVGLIAVLNLVNQLLTNRMTGATFFIVCFLLPILIGLGVVMFLKGQLKSVRSQLATNYITDAGLQLTVSRDVYEWTETRSRTIESK